MAMGVSSGCQTMFFSGFVQISCFFIFNISKSFLLDSMTYNCYVANCTPLLYHLIMSPRLCLQLVAATFAVGLMNMVHLTSKTSHLTFYKFHVIIHYFCDIPPFLKLSCSATQIPQLILFDCGGFNISVSITIILVSYTYVFLAIIRIPSAQGKHETFSTCASRMSAVSLYCRTTVFIYLRPSSEYLPGQDRLFSVVFYTVVLLMFNPIIYSLRNKDIKETFGNIIKKAPHLFSFSALRVP